MGGGQESTCSCSPRGSGPLCFGHFTFLLGFSSRAEHCTLGAAFHTGEGACRPALERVHALEAETLKSCASDLAQPLHPHLIPGLLSPPFSSFRNDLRLHGWLSSHGLSQDGPGSAKVTVSGPWKTSLMLQIHFHCSVCY